jgi:hypothetical protein
MPKSGNDAVLKGLYLLAHWDGQGLNVYFKVVSLNQQSDIQNFVYDAMDKAELSPVSSRIQSDRRSMSITYGFARDDWHKAQAFCRDFEGQYGYDAPNAVPFNGHRKARGRVVQKRSPSV